MRLLLFLTAACSDPVDPAIELGTGTGAFESLVERQDLGLVYGPQGGWHVNVALRTSGLDPEDVWIGYTAEDAAGNPISFPAEMQLADNLVLSTSTGWDRLGDRVVFDIAEDVEVLDQSVVLRVEVGRGEERWTDERNVVVR